MSSNLKPCSTGLENVKVQIFFVGIFAASLLNLARVLVEFAL